jgi:hypothetical protein
MARSTLVPEAILTRRIVGFSKAARSGTSNIANAFKQKCFVLYRWPSVLFTHVPSPNNDAVVFGLFPKSNAGLNVALGCHATCIKS